MIGTGTKIPQHGQSIVYRLSPSDLAKAVGWRICECQSMRAIEFGHSRNELTMSAYLMAYNIHLPLVPSMQVILFVSIPTVGSKRHIRRSACHVALG